MKMKILDKLKIKAKQKLRRIVLPESEDIRILKAAIEIDADKLASVVLLGDKVHLTKKIAAINPYESSIDIVNHKDITLIDTYAEVLWQKRRHKGLSKEKAYELVNDKIVFAMLMLEYGAADAVVAGAASSSQKVVRFALQIVGMKDGYRLLSSFFLMLFDHSNDNYGSEMIFADCAINVEPDANDLFEIAKSSLKNAKNILSKEPKIAFLSFSTNNSASHKLVDKVNIATKIFKKAFSNYQIIGDVQLDAALEKKVLTIKYPNSNFTPPANVFIFPSLEAANIGYKLVQRFAKSQAIGPILQGLSKPVNDLSRGCSVDDIINTIIVTINQI